MEPRNDGPTKESVLQKVRQWEPEGAEEQGADGQQGGDGQAGQEPELTEQERQRRAVLRKVRNAQLTDARERAPGVSTRAMLPSHQHTTTDQQLAMPASDPEAQDAAEPDHDRLDRELEAYEGATTFFGRTVDRLKKGYLQARESLSASNLAGLGSDVQAFDAIDRGEVELYELDEGSLAEAYYFADEPTRQQIREQAGMSMERQASDVVRFGQQARAIRGNPVAEQMVQARTYTEAFQLFMRDPIGVIGELGLTSLPRSAPSLLLGAAAGPLGAGYGSFQVEHQAAILEGLQRAGVDISDPDAIAQAVKDPRLMDEVYGRAAVRSGVISAVDALSFGVASKTLAPAIKSPWVRQGVNLGAQAYFQAGLGATGEALAMLATGEPVSGGEVLGEAVGELVQAPAEVVAASAEAYTADRSDGPELTVRTRRGRRRVRKIMRRLGLSQEQIDVAMSELQQRERTKSKLQNAQQAVDEAAENDEADVVEAAAEAMEGRQPSPAVQASIAAMMEHGDVEDLQFMISELEERGYDVPPELLDRRDELEARAEEPGPDPQEEYERVTREAQQRIDERAEAARTTATSDDPEAELAREAAERRAASLEERVDPDPRAGEPPPSAQAAEHVEAAREAADEGGIGGPDRPEDVEDVDDFELTSEWQPVPEGVILPNGAEVRIDTQTGDTIARIDPRARRGAPEGARPDAEGEDGADRAPADRTREQAADPDRGAADEDARQPGGEPPASRPQPPEAGQEEAAGADAEGAAPRAERPRSIEEQAALGLAAQSTVDKSALKAEVAKAKAALDEARAEANRARKTMEAERDRQRGPQPEPEQTDIFGEGPAPQQTPAQKQATQIGLGDDFEADVSQEAIDAAMEPLDARVDALEKEYEKAVRRAQRAGLELSRNTIDLYDDARPDSAPRGEPDRDRGDLPDGPGAARQPGAQEIPEVGEQAADVGGGRPGVEGGPAAAGAAAEAGPEEGGRGAERGEGVGREDVQAAAADVPEGAGAVEPGQAAEGADVGADERPVGAGGGPIEAAQLGRERLAPEAELGPNPQPGILAEEGLRPSTEIAPHDGRPYGEVKRRLASYREGRAGSEERVREELQKQIQLLQAYNAGEILPDAYTPPERIEKQVATILAKIRYMLQALDGVDVLAREAEFVDVSDATPADLMIRAERKATEGDPLGIRAVAADMGIARDVAARVASLIERLAELEGAEAARPALAGFFAQGEAWSTEVLEDRIERAERQAEAEDTGEAPYVPRPYTAQDAREETTRAFNRGGDRGDHLPQQVAEAMATARMAVNDWLASQGLRYSDNQAPTGPIGAARKVNSQIGGAAARLASKLYAIARGHKRINPEAVLTAQQRINELLGDVEEMTGTSMPRVDLQPALYVLGEQYLVYPGPQGEILVSNRNTGNTVSSRSSNYEAAIVEYLAEATEALDTAPRVAGTVEVPTPEAFVDYVLGASSNIYELLEAFSTARQLQQEQQAPNTTGDTIASWFEGGGRVSTSSFDRFGDPNWRAGTAIAVNYLSADGQGIDVLAEILTGQQGTEITPQDIIDFMMEYSGGPAAFRNEDTELVEAARQAFEERTDVTLTDELAEAIYAEAYEQPEPTTEADDRPQAPFSREAVPDDRRQPDSDIFERGEVAPAEAVAQAIADLAEQEELPDVEVVLGPEELPPETRKLYRYWQRKSEGQAIQTAMYHDGRVYIVASEIAYAARRQGIDPRRLARQTYLHEVVAHAGLRRLFGDEASDVFEALVYAIGGERLYAEGIPWMYADMLDGEPGEPDTWTSADKELLADEYMARLAEGLVDRPTPGLLRRIFDTIRDGLQRLVGNVPDADLQLLLMAAADHLRATQREADVEATRFMFAGAKAKGFIQADQRGTTFEGFDGHSRFEISDVDATIEVRGDDVGHFRRAKMAARKYHETRMEHRRLLMGPRNDETIAQLDELTSQMQGHKQALELMLFKLRDEGIRHLRNDGQAFPLFLEELLDHPRLYEEYPQLRKIPILPGAMEGRGGYQKGAISIHLAILRQLLIEEHTDGDVTPGWTSAPARDPGRTLRDVLLHELQHAVQDIEAWAAGSSMTIAYNELRIEAIDRLMQTETWQGDEAGAINGHGDEQLEREIILLAGLDPDDPDVELRDAVYAYYRAAAGEIEARFVQRRRMMPQHSRERQALGELPGAVPLPRPDDFRGELVVARTMADLRSTWSERGFHKVRFHRMPNGFRVRHGTPYLFDAFSTDYIGEGEGAQAFGWGLYFTESEEVARWYATNVSRRIGEPITIGDETFDTDVFVGRLGDDLPRYGQRFLDGIRDMARASSTFDRKVPTLVQWFSGQADELRAEESRLLEEAETTTRGGAVSMFKREDAKKYGRAAELFERAAQSIQEVDGAENIRLGSRHVYETRLHSTTDPDEWTYIDWREPVDHDLFVRLINALHEEGHITEEDVSLQIGELAEETGMGYWRATTPGGMGRTGETLYHALEITLGSPKAASLWLLEHGVDGIAYQANQGRSEARNYVVFDDEAVHIENVVRFARERGDQADLFATEARANEEGGIRPQGNLIALHNLTESNIRFADKLGALPMPSVAITKYDQPLASFGEISLIAPRELVDPERGDVRVFDADIYSPRVPRARPSPKMGEVHKFNSRLFKYTDRFPAGARLSHHPAVLEQAAEMDGLDEVIQRAQHMEDVQLMYFAEEHGIDIEVPTTLPDGEWIDHVLGPASELLAREFGGGELISPMEVAGDPVLREQVWMHVSRSLVESYAAHGPSLAAVAEDIAASKWAGEKKKVETMRAIIGDYNKLVANPQGGVEHSVLADRIRAAFDKTGGNGPFLDWIRREAEQWFGEPKLQLDDGRLVPYKIDHIVKKMMAQPVQGGEVGDGFIRTIGMLRAIGAQQFATIEEMKEEAPRLVTTKQMEAAKEQIDAELDAIVEWIYPQWKYEDDAAMQFRMIDHFYEAVAEYYRMGRPTLDGLRQVLTEWGFPGVMDTPLRELMQWAEDLRMAPTEYFEAKLMRGVGLEEFVAAVVPMGTSGEVLDILRRHGIERIIEYDRVGGQMTGTNQRTAALDVLEDVRFARVDPEQTRAPAFQEWFGPSKVVDEDGEPLVVYHGAPNAGAFGRFREPEWEDLRPGIYFTKNRRRAATYAEGIEAEPTIDPEGPGQPGVLPVYLSMHDPLRIDFEGQGWNEIVEDADGDVYTGIDDVARRAREMGYDGVIAENIVDDGPGGFFAEPGTTYVVFYSSQIKSATQNVGTFDFRNPDIRFSRRPGQERPFQLDRALGIRFNRRQEDTPAFKQWFGDWRRNPTGASKVVGEDGRPLVVYHGTAADVDFDEFAVGSSGFRGRGIYATDTPIVAEEFANIDAVYKARPGQPRIMPVYLDIKNPAVFSDAAAFQREAEDFVGGPEAAMIEPLMGRTFGAQEAYSRALQEQGHDGIIIENAAEPGLAGGVEWREYVAFTPRQVKSATGNRGTFDPRVSNIRFARFSDEQKKRFRQMLDQIDQTEPGQPTGIGRPELANPVQNDEGRIIVDATDELRAQEGTPGEQTFQQWRQQAAQLLDEDYEGTKRRIFEGDELDDPVLVMAARMILEEESNGAIASGDQQALVDLALLIDKYRTLRTDTARALAAGRDLSETPEERRRRIVLDAVHTPSQAARDQLRTLEKKMAETFERRDAAARRIRELEEQMQAQGTALREMQQAREELELLLAQAEADVEQARAELAEAEEALQAVRKDNQTLRRKRKRREEALERTTSQLAEVRSEISMLEPALAELKEELSQARKERRRLQQQRDRAEASIEQAQRRVLEQHAEAVITTREALAKKGIDVTALTDAELEDPRIMWRVIRTAQAAKGDWKDAIYEYWINAILSAPTTQAANILGNTINSVWDFTFQRWAEALVEVVTPGGLSPSEALTELKYLYKGLTGATLRNAWRRARLAFDTEMPVLAEELGIEDFTTKLESVGRSKAIAGVKGRAVRLPGRGLVAMDEMFKSIFWSMEVGAQAYRIAQMEGLQGEAMARRIDELMRDGTGPASRRAFEHSKYLTFQNELGTWGQKLIELRKAKRPLTFILPFITTPFNIFKVGIRKSPLGSLALGSRLVRHGLYTLGISDSAEMIYERHRFKRDAAEQVLAWTLFYGIHSIVAAGFDDEDDEELPHITGSGADYNNRGELMLERRGVPPQSIRIGSTWYSYARLEPFATQLTVIVDLSEAIHRADRGEDINAIVGDTWKTVVKMARDKTFLQGVGDIIRAIEYPERGVPRWAIQFGTSWMPNIWRSGARAGQDQWYDLTPKGEGLDWLRSALKMAARKNSLMPWDPAAPAVDVWGRERRKYETDQPLTDWVYRFTTPIWRQDADHLHQLDRLLMRYNAQYPNEQWLPSMPRPTLQQTVLDRTGEEPREVRQTVRLTDAEFYLYLKLSGQLAAEMLKEAPLNYADPGPDDVEMIQDALRDARSDVRELILYNRQIGSGIEEMDVEAARQVEDVRALLPEPSQ